MVNAILALLCVAGMFYFSGPTSFFCGVGLFIVGMVAALDLYAVEKKNESESSANSNSAPELQAETTSPANAPSGSPTGTTSTGEVYVRGNEQAEAGVYDNTSSPADTVTVRDGATAHKSNVQVEFEI